MFEDDSCEKCEFMTVGAFVDLVNSMIKSEDVQISSIPDEDFEVIETIYRYHPAIDVTFGWEKIADLYANFGFSVIMDMLPRAEKMRYMEKQLEVIESTLAGLREEMDAVRKGMKLPTN